jgi:hypothetical protein
MPENDTTEHLELRQCWCRPTVDENQPTAIVIHHSADGREYFEEPTDA